MPAFQKSYLTNNDSLLVSNGKRVIPDVADQSYQGFGVWNEIELSPFVGGSSVVATGRWAGIAALLAEGLQEKSYSLAELLRASGGLNNLLYATDVAKTFSRPTADGFHAEQGLGVPDVTKLISALRSRVPLIASAVQGTTLNPLMSIRSLNGTYVLKMQLDGNLVLFNGSGSAIWNTGTQSYPGAYATLQKDGNLVVYDAKAQYKWASWSNSYTGINARLSIDDDGSMRIFKPQTSLWTIGTRLTSYADPQPAWGSSVWPIGTILKNGQFISSVNGENKFVMQNDGNLVLYHKDVATWSSATNGNVNAYAKMQADGNLVVYAADGSALWHAGTWGHPGASAVVQDDGTVVLYTWQFMN
jgi:hypothetical protein